MMNPIPMLKSLLQSTLQVPGKVQNFVNEHPLLKKTLLLPVKLILAALWILSLGAIKMPKGDQSKGAVSQVWRLFYPFLISREPWEIKMPAALKLPWLERKGFSFKRSHIDVSLPYGGKLLLTLPELVKAWGLIALSGLGIYLVNYYAVQMNELNGAFMNSITDKNAAKFTEVLWACAQVYAIYTLLGPLYAYVKELIILEWTKSSTRSMLRLYMQDRNYYPVSLLRLPDNPNERIQQDVPAMCRAAMSFAFIIVDSLVTFVLFGSILWNAEKGLSYDIPFHGQHFVVEHLLLWILLGYVLFGTNGVIRVGKRLIGLQAEQKRLGADFRVGMVLFEKYAEPIAAYHGEEAEYKHLWASFMLALQNNYAIIRWQRNLGFFTSGYSRVAGLLPYGVLAPFYFAGKIAFGTISQAVGAFGEILSSASVFISQFDQLTGLLASINRVGELRSTLEDLSREQHDGKPRVKHTEGKLLEISGLTLYTPDRAKIIVRDFNLVMEPGRSVLIKGPSGSGKTSILRAVVGLPYWDRGEGTIAMPSKIGATLMLSQLAYVLNKASLREQLLYPAAGNLSDAELLDALEKVNLGDLAARIGGLDARPNWDSLSGGERQRLVIARALVNRVRLVIADEATSGLDIANEERMYEQMRDAKITTLSVGHRPSLVKFHTDVVELAGDGKGGWRIMPASESKW